MGFVGANRLPRRGAVIRAEYKRESNRLEARARRLQRKSKKQAASKFRPRILVILESMGQGLCRPLKGKLGRENRHDQPAVMSQARKY